MPLRLLTIRVLISYVLMFNVIGTLPLLTQLIWFMMSPFFSKCIDIQIIGVLLIVIIKCWIGFNMASTSNPFHQYLRSFKSNYPIPCLNCNTGGPNLETIIYEVVLLFKLIILYHRNSMCRAVFSLINQVVGSDQFQILSS